MFLYLSSRPRAGLVYITRYTVEARLVNVKKTATTTTNRCVGIGYE